VLPLHCLRMGPRYLRPDYNAQLSTKYSFAPLAKFERSMTSQRAMLARQQESKVICAKVQVSSKWLLPEKSAMAPRSAAHKNRRWVLARFFVNRLTLYCRTNSY
jgi:hypothetical protein